MIRCPLKNEEIDEGECVVTVDACDSMIKERVIEKKILEQKNWKEICRKCKYHDN